MTTPSTTLVLPDGTTYDGRLQHDDDGKPVVVTATCGVCGFSWNDALITSVTPVPAGRCPNEYAHAKTRGDRLDELVAGHTLDVPDFDDGDDVPQYALITAEGSGESCYQDNPDLSLFANRETLAAAIADNLSDGWPPVAVVDLDTGEEVGFHVSVTITEDDA